MLKTLALTFFLGLGFVNIAYADPLPIATAQMCDTEPGKVISMVQDKYGEEPFLVGNTVVQNLRGGWMKGELLMFIHPENHNFSIVITDPITGLECLWLAGDDVQPVYR